MFFATLSQLTLLAAGTAQAKCLDTTYCDTGLPVVNASSSQIQQILQIVFGIIAALAVLFVVIGGFRYVLSGGDPEDTKRAKATIMYALIGLVVAISAETIVSFVLNKA
ncbi:MAG TPA: pilin [Candidatus Saccharimonadales bacterium]|nr:pilin [Candidatus Saccharimonadales bacterium]